MNDINDFGKFVIKCLKDYGVTEENFYTDFNGRIHNQFLNRRKWTDSRWCRIYLDNRYICTVSIEYCPVDRVRGVTQWKEKLVRIIEEDLVDSEEIVYDITEAKA